MPITVKAKLLLGWMPEAEALAMLDKCVFNPARTVDEHRALWQQYRDRVTALPQECEPLREVKLTLLEKSKVNTFLKKFKGMPIRRHMVRAVKFSNPGQLPIRQFFVLPSRGEMYSKAVTDNRTRIHHCLGIGLDERHKVTHTQKGTTTIVRLPHFEFEVKARPGGFDISEMGRSLTLAQNGGRYALWSGYHRTHALLSQMTPEADGEAPLFILMKEVAEADLFFGANSDRPLVRDALAATRPPLFKDFFANDLFIEVDLLKQRREIHIEPNGQLIQATNAYVEDES